MPSEHSPSSKSKDYPTDRHRVISEWSEEMLTSLRLYSEEDARKYLGVANELDAPITVKKHLADEIKRLK